MISPTTFNITTLLLMALTAWVLHMRYRTKLENNWPLIYYGALVAYTIRFEGVINPNAVFATVVAALLLRFEFLGGWVLKSVYVLEGAGLVFAIACCLHVLRIV